MATVVDDVETPAVVIREPESVIVWLELLITRIGGHGVTEGVGKVSVQAAEVEAV